MRRASVHGVKEITGNIPVVANVRDSTVKIGSWIYIKNKKLIGTSWRPRYVILESTKVEDSLDMYSGYKTVIKIFKSPGSKLLASIFTDEVQEFCSVDDCHTDKPSHDRGSWGKIIIFVRGKERYELAVKNMNKSEEWKDVLKEMEYYINMRRELGIGAGAITYYQREDSKALSKFLSRAKKSFKHKRRDAKKGISKCQSAEINNHWYQNQSLFISGEFEHLNLLKYGGSLVMHHADLNLINVKSSFLKCNYNPFFYSASKNNQNYGHVNEFLRVMNMKSESSEDIKKKDDAYLNLLARFRCESITNAKVIIDEYHKTEVVQSYSSDLNLSGSRQLCRVGTDPLASKSKDGNNLSHRNNLYRSYSSMANMDSSKPARLAFLEFDEDLYGRKIKEKDGVTYKIIPYSADSSGSFTYNLKKISLEIQGISMIMTEMNLSNGYIGVYPAPIVLVEYKGFAIIAEPTFLADTSIIKPVHMFEGPKAYQSQAVLEKLSKLSKLFNLKPHPIVTDGLCVNNVTSSGVVGYVVGDGKEIYLRNLRSLLPLDHICGVDNKNCKVSDQVINKHLDSMKMCNDSLVLSSIESGTDLFKSSSIYDMKLKPGQIHPAYENQRFRPEFLSLYTGKGLCSDAFTIYSSGGIDELIENNKESIEAANFLRFKWIPMFASALDNLSIRALESGSLTSAMHSCGINMRYLGLVAWNSRLPLVKTLVHTEMIARATKVLFRDRIRERILYFTRIGATKVYSEQARRTIKIVNNVLSAKRDEKFFTNVIFELVMKKFNYRLKFSDMDSIPLQFLLNAIQYNWGLQIEGDLDSSKNIIHKKVKIVYVPKHKAPIASCYSYPYSEDVLKAASLINKYEISGSNNNFEYDRFIKEHVAYFLHRHFCGIHVGSKMEASNSTAEALVVVAAYYNKICLSQEAEVYVQAAINNKPPNDLWKGLAYHQLLVSKVNNIVKHRKKCPATRNVLLDEFVSTIRPQLSEAYDSAIFYMQNNLPKNHIALVTVHDTMIKVCLSYYLYDEAIVYLTKSLNIIHTILGKNHVITANYEAKMGRYYLKAMNYRDAIYWLESSRKALIGTSTHESTLMGSEIELNLAEAYLRMGAHDKALYYAELSANTRSEKLGNINSYTVNSYLILIEVLIAHISSSVDQDFKHRISCRKVISLLEKVFLFIKLYGKSVIESNDHDYNSISTITPKNDSYDALKHHKSPNLNVYLTLLSKEIGNGYINKVEIADNVESLRNDATFEEANTAGQFSELLIRNNPLSSVLTYPIPLSGPCIDHKFVVLPTITINVLYSTISRVFSIKLQEVRDGNAKNIVNTILSKVKEKKNIFNQCIIHEVIKSIYVIGPDLYIEGVIRRIAENDPTAQQELEICADIASYNHVTLGYAYT